MGYTSHTEVIINPVGFFRNKYGQVMAAKGMIIQRHSIPTCRDR